MTGAVQDAGSWRPDILGERFERLTLPLADDFEGEVVATLVRYNGPWKFRWQRPPASGFDVLYVHGWNDYFFQKELAEFWHAAGARFYALDLRKYGRSLREHQTPGFIADLTSYDEDIAAALVAMGQAPAGAAIDAAVGGNGRPLILLGHSSGGLTLSLWAHRHPGRAHALILNSPWLEFQMSGFGRDALASIMRAGARVEHLSARALPSVDLGFYNRAVAHDQEGEWEFDAHWRPARGFPTHAAWLAAMLDGHARVAAGLNVHAPVLTLLSARSTFSPRWMPEMLQSDSVLVVDDIAERSLRLGQSVTVNRFDGALHDVFLSRKAVREQAYAAMARWIRAYL